MANHPIDNTFSPDLPLVEIIDSVHADTVNPLWSRVLNNTVSTHYFINVKEHGAVGDGVTDDTTAVQAAIDAASDGQRVFFPYTGNPYLCGALTGKAGIGLVGENFMEFNDSLSTLKYNTTTGNFISLAGADTTRGMLFENMIIDFNASTGRCIDLKTSRSRFFDCTIKNGGAGSFGVHFSSGASTAVESGLWRCLIHGFGTGIHADDKATDGFIRDCLIYQNTSKHIELETALGWLVDGNHLYSSTSTPEIGIDVQTSLARITNNMVEGAETGTGFIGIKQIYTTNFNSGIISANTITLATNDSIGIDLTATVACRGKVDNNTVIDEGATGTTGIKVSGSFEIFGDLSMNNLDNVDTRISTTFTNNPVTLEIVGAKLQTSAIEFTMRSLSGPVKTRTASGSPETVVTANVGSMFLRTDGGVGTSVYAKESGTGNTGWRAVTTELTAEVASPAQITANQNDYQPGVTASFWRLSTDASRDITGFTGGKDGRMATIVNVGSFDVVLTNQDVLSTEGNRIITGTAASVTLAPDDTADLIYDGTTTRWRITSTA